MTGRVIEKWVLNVLTVFLGLTVPIILLFLGQALGGAGHGSSAFVLATGSPLSFSFDYTTTIVFTPLVWLAGSVLLILRTQPWARVILIALLGFQAVGWIYFTMREGADLLIKTTVTLAPFAAIYFAIYFTSVGIVIHLLKRAQRTLGSEH